LLQFFAKAGPIVIYFKFFLVPTINTSAESNCSEWNSVRFGAQNRGEIRCARSNGNKLVIILLIIDAAIIINIQDEHCPPSYQLAGGYSAIAGPNWYLLNFCFKQ
jgi:hypothetical protein